MVSRWIEAHFRINRQHGYCLGRQQGEIGINFVRSQRIRAGNFSVWNWNALISQRMFKTYQIWIEGHSQNPVECVCLPIWSCTYFFVLTSNSSSNLYFFLHIFRVFLGIQRGTTWRHWVMTECSGYSTGVESVSSAEHIKVTCLCLNLTRSPIQKLTISLQILNTSRTFAVWPFHPTEIWSSLPQGIWKRVMRRSRTFLPWSIRASK